MTGVTEGSRVLISCISGCGRCRFCRTGAYGQCLDGGGWVLGHLIDGTQAEYVRVPFADLSLHAIPETVSDEAALMLADIMPTAYEVGVLNGRVSPGDTVAVVGAGPIGLAAIQTARLFSPARVIAIDLAESRLEAAKLFGADTRSCPRPTPKGWLPSHRGARCRCGDRGRRSAGDVELCTRLVRAGGRVASVGVRHTGQPPSGRSVDQERHDHDRPGRHLLHADPDEHAGHGATRHSSLRHSPLPDGRDDRGLRRILPSLDHRCPQDGPDPLMKQQHRRQRLWTMANRNSMLQPARVGNCPDDIDEGGSGDRS